MRDVLAGSTTRSARCGVGERNRRPAPVASNLVQTSQSRPIELRSRGDTAFLVMVGVLPLHTVFFSAWISWKPYLLALVGLVVIDVIEGLHRREWPYRRSISVALLGFGIVALTGFPAPQYRERFLQLGLALAVGAMVMLVTDRRLRAPGMIDRVLAVAFWTGAGMGVTAVVFSLVNLGVFGAGLVDAINAIPGVFRTSKPAYLTEGFIALTNWHQDPGYGAAWSVLWACLALVATARGVASRRWWVNATVIGLLGFGVVMAFSRTGWLSLPLGLGIVGLTMMRTGSIGGRLLLRTLGTAAAIVAVTVAAMFVVDRPFVAGDVDLQFAFRLSQGWDLIADITGLFETSDEAFADRFEPSEERADVWPEYWRMFLDNPVLGVGLGVGWLTNSILQEPHNLFLELLSEMGIVGLLAFGALIVAIVRSGRGRVSVALLVVAFLPAMTQTVLFEPTWWFAAGIHLSGSLAVTPSSGVRLTS